MTPTALLKLSSYIKTNPPSYFIIAISFLISLTTSQTVPIQNETATQDIYYATRDTAGVANNGFRLGTIECATDKECIIYCDIATVGCNLATIDARNAKSLYLECNKVSACNILTVYGPTGQDSSATIICNQNTACAGPSTNFHLNNTGDANVICTGSLGPDAGSCLDLKIFSASDVNNVNISCGENDCKRMELWTKPASFNTFLTCDGENSCTDAQVKCVGDNGQSDLSWNTGDNEWECSDESCCPLVDMLPLIPGGFNAPFEIVDCSNIQDCVNRYIDGSGLTVNMTVNCDTANSCHYAKIICPPSESCIINCGTNSCHDILIDATLSSNLYLKCDEISACEKADVYCSSDEGSCFIECGGKASACNNTQIFQSNLNANNYFDIKCPPPSNFEDACNNIRFHCSASTTIYTTLLWDDVIQKSGGQCTDVTSDCCPFGTPSPTTAPPTTAQPTSDPTTKAPATAGGTSQPTTADGVVGGGDPKEEESGELIYIIIGGFGVLALCVCFWGGFIWWQKRKNSGYGNEGGRGSKSSRGNNKYGSGNNNNYNNNTNIHDTGSQTNPGAYGGGAYGGGGVTPMMGHNLSDKPAHLEIEKSMEMPSTTQASITEPTRTHNTITTYAPGRDYKKNGAGATITAYSRNPSNAPPSLGLADLGNNNGW